jgi:putative ABC transport system permease protein
MNGLLQDLRYGWRSLLRSPGFAFVVVGTLALGVGVNSLIFSLVNTMALRPLPHIREAGLTRLALFDLRRGERYTDELSYPDLNDIRARARSFSAIAGFTESQAYLTLDREPEQFSSAFITSGLFRALGTAPALGREFEPSEEKDGNQWSTIMISHRIWKERLGGDPHVLGRTLKMNGRVRTIVGVAPPGMLYPETADFWIPLGFKPEEDKRNQQYIDVVARLKPGVSIEQANAEVKAISADLARLYPDTNKDHQIQAEAYRAGVIREMGPIMAVLMAAVVFVLLIACANIANLMLARGAGRMREIGLRFALGASRGRIVRQLLTESLLAAVIGGAIGIVLSQIGMDLVLSSIPQELPFWMNFGLDGRVIAYTAGVCVLAALIFGLAPALQVSSIDPHDALKEGGAQGGRRGNRIRNGLVVAEVALSLVLLAGAGLMIRSFLHRMAESSRIDMRGVLTANVTLPIAVYKDDDARLAFYDALFPAIEGLPGVEVASAVQALPLGTNSWRTIVAREGVPADFEENPSTRPPYVFYGITRPRYFEALRIPLKAGRDFTTADRNGAGKVAIINETAARMLWKDKDPLGRRFKFGARDTSDWTTVVGVVGDVRQRIEDAEPSPHVFVPHMQSPVQTLTLLVRGTAPPGAMATAVRRLVQSRDPDLPLYRVKTMRQAAWEGLWEQRIYVWLMGVFATMALVIAAVGIYGVMAYSVSQRTQEIGIRMALGAASHDVVRMIVGQAMRLTVLGLGIGLAAAYGVTRLLASMLFGVSASDPPTFIGVAVILALSGIVAAWVPSWRATRVDPMVALRSE